MGGVMGMVQKATPRAKVHPTVRDLAWAAGFLEGEGHFRKTENTQQVQATQVQREPLTRLQRIFGGKIVRQHKKLRPNQNQCWEWKVCGARARGVMLTMLVFMSPRRKRQIVRSLHK